MARTANSTVNGTSSAVMTQLPYSELLHALQAVRDGNFSVRLPGDRTGIEGKIADTFNEIVTSNERMAAELRHVGNAVGKIDGQCCQQWKGNTQGCLLKIIVIGFLYAACRVYWICPQAAFLRLSPQLSTLSGSATATRASTGRNDHEQRAIPEQ